MKLFALISVVTAFVIFLAYNIALWIQFKIPSSLSESFYLYDKKRKNLGYIFTGMMFLTAFLLLPGWIEVSEASDICGVTLTFLAFFTCAAICFVGAAPAFRASEIESKVHSISAKVCAVAALLWDFIVCWKIMYVPIATMLLVLLVAWLTKTLKSGMIYWLEMCAFFGTFFTIAAQLGVWLIG